MGLLSWIVVGLIAGAVASRVTGYRIGCLTKIGVGVIGALIGGALARAAGLSGVRHFGLGSVLLAAAGATVLLLVVGAIERGQSSRRR
jgi:uncharacterized membrane protein YeaQ/YmgE (transglycosylase-associated protein family)